MPHPTIEIRGFKYPRRPTSIAWASDLGQDIHGRWLGITKGNPWRAADNSRSGIFEASFVKLVPNDTFWSVCFHPHDPVVDVDIILPVTWNDHILEEVDLELDVLRLADGTVHIRDQDKFASVRANYKMPNEIAAKAQAACNQIHAKVQAGDEPFAQVGRAWLTRFTNSR